MQVAEKILRCHKCGEAMYFKEPGFWKCPFCAGEFWEEDEPEEVQIRECYIDSLTVPIKKRFRGGGGGRKTNTKLRLWKPWMAY